MVPWIRHQSVDMSTARSFGWGHEYWANDITQTAFNPKSLPAIHPHTQHVMLIRKEGIVVVGGEDESVSLKSTF